MEFCSSALAKASNISLMWFCSISAAWSKSMALLVVEVFCFWLRIPQYLLRFTRAFLAMRRNGETREVVYNNQRKEKNYKYICLKFENDETQLHQINWALTVFFFKFLFQNIMNMNAYRFASTNGSNNRSSFNRSWSGHDGSVLWNVAHFRLIFICKLYFHTVKNFKVNIQKDVCMCMYFNTKFFKIVIWDQKRLFQTWKSSILFCFAALQAVCYCKLKRVREKIVSEGCSV